MTNIYMANNPSKKQYGNLAGRLCVLAAGCGVDAQAVRERQLDLASLRRLGEAFRLGWLYNVMSRITPLTTRSLEDYIAMADLFIESATEAEHLLDRFDADLEEFCRGAGIMVSSKMSYDNVSPELSAHIQLYRAVNTLFTTKFGCEERNPIANLAAVSADEDDLNPYLKEFVDQKFKK